MWIASTKNTVSNNQRYKIVRNVDFKPFPSHGSGFLFEMVTAGRYIPKNWANFSAVFSLPLEIGEGFFLPFVKFIKVFDEKYFVSRNPNKEIVLFWTKF
ncbi:MAG: hypothetical protein SPE83_03255 [Streptococcus suis]|nr:hypothetical protein [Streptococcus suis]MDY5054315.1 hypothetical protein [Streptococcus suis]